jgi:alpha-beta hydrolase superfamily lysophospholipase
MNKTAVEFQKLNDAAKLCIPKISCPVLILHGAEDTLTLVKGADYVFDNVATDPKSKTRIIYDGLRHEIFREREPDRSKVYADVSHFLTCVSSGTLTSL